jgi:FkbM family methyltransferase
MKRNFLFDLGFHKGEGLKYLWELYQVDESWTVFAFEPNSACRRHLLRANTLLLPRVNGLPMAAHTTPGPAVFQREVERPGGAEDGTGSHLTGLGFHLDPHGAGTEEVWTVDFPLLLRALIPPGREHSYVVVKMDIEGAEYGILRAMLADGSIDLVDVLHVEFHHHLMPAESEESTEALRAAVRQRVELVEHW